MGSSDREPKAIEIITRIPRLPSRPEDAHKGMFGHALLVGGVHGMTGAVTIAGLAALRVGAGLVTLAVPMSGQPIVAAANPCAMTLGLAEDGDGRLIPPALALLQTRMRPGTILGIGPGLGRSQTSDEIAVTLFKSWTATALFDADALNALASSDVWRTMFTDEHAPVPFPRIMTPHPGEWSRLCGVPASDTDQQRDAAHRLAARLGVVIVLKGNRTLVTDGSKSYVNTTGNPSLAVGGSGDALSGIITGLVCQGLPAFQAAVLGVHLHGLAGDLAHRELGTPSTLATDLINSLPAAFRGLSRGS